MVTNGPGCSNRPDRAERAIALTPSRLPARRRYARIGDYSPTTWRPAPVLLAGGTGRRLRGSGRAVLAVAVPPADALLVLGLPAGLADPGRRASSMCPEATHPYMLSCRYLGFSITSARMRWIAIRLDEAAGEGVLRRWRWFVVQIAPAAARSTSGQLAILACP